jgi:hypothetical protein
MQSIYRRIRPYKVTEEIVAQIKSLDKRRNIAPWRTITVRENLVRPTRSGPVVNPRGD